MKFEMSAEIRKKIMIYSIIIAIGITIFFAYERMEVIGQVFSTFMKLCTPFIIGFSFAFLLNKPMMFIERHLFSKSKLNKRTKRNISAVFAIIFGIVVVSLFLAILLPQLVSSLVVLVKSFPGYLSEFQKLSDQFIADYNIDQKLVSTYLNSSTILSNVTTFMSGAIPKIFATTFQLGSLLLNLLLGIMSALYMLMDKERLLGYVKKVNYVLFPKEISFYLHRMSIASSAIFNNFIIGKFIDSLIIGILCYLGLLVFNIPYALLLAVIVGITNMIPVFGPFIGAIPGIFILFIIHPITALYFALFILALQQFDGNILGPLILGDKLGIPTLGILVSVVVGGGLFGIIGMFIGVPCFAVIYTAVKEYVDMKIAKDKIDVEHQSELAIELVKKMNKD